MVAKVVAMHVTYIRYCSNYQLNLEVKRPCCSYFSYFHKFSPHVSFVIVFRGRESPAPSVMPVYDPHMNMILTVVECTHITNTCLVMKGISLSWDLCSRRDDGVEREKIIITNRINQYRAIPPKV